MIKILHKFFNFCGKNNKRKFQISIFLGAIQALCEAMKIPAIMIILIAIMNNSLNTGVIFTTLGIMIGSMIIDFTQFSFDFPCKIIRFSCKFLL